MDIRIGPAAGRNIDGRVLIDQLRNMTGQVCGLVALAWIAAIMSCVPDRTAGSILVTSGTTDHVYVLDAQTGDVQDSVALDPRRGEIDEPHGIATSGSQDHWYVTLSHGEPTLWKFESRGNRLVGRVRLEMAGASRIGLSHDGRFAYIPDYYRDDVDVPGEVIAVQLHDLTVVARASICPAPHDAQPSPDGRWIAVTCSSSDEVVFLDPTTLGIEDVVTFGETSSKPLNVVWDEDGSAYVSLQDAGKVAQIRPEIGIVATGSVGSGPAQLALSPVRAVVVTANRTDGSSSIVSTKSLTELRRVPLGVSHPHGVALSPDGRLAFITYEGSPETRGGVVAIDLETHTVSWRKEIGTYTLGVTYVTLN